MRSVLVEAVDALHEGVVVGIADGADGGKDLFQREVFGVADAGVLRSGVAVVDQLSGQVRVAFSSALPQRHAQRCHDQVGDHRGGGFPADDALGEFLAVFGAATWLARVHGEEEVVASAESGEVGGR